MSTLEYSARRFWRPWLPRLRAAASARSIRTEIWILGALIVTAAAIRIVTIDNQSLWMDEALTAYEAHLPFGAMLNTVVHVETTPPLYFLLAWASAKLFGPGAVAIRLVSTVAGIGLVPIAYLTGRDLISRRAGLLSAALAASSPFLIWYSQEARSYMLLGTLTGASFLWFVRASRDPSRRNLAWWAGCSSLALMTHFFAGFIVAPEAIWLLGISRTRRVGCALGAVIAVEVAIAPLAFLDTSHSTGWIHGLPIVNRLGGASLEFGLATLYRDFTAAQGLIGAGVLLLVLAAVLIFGGDRVTRRAAALGGVILTAGILTPLALMAVGQDYFLSRNLMPIWLPLATVVTAACVAPRARLAGAALSAIVIAGSVYATIDVQTNPALQRPAWRQLANVIGPASAPRAILAAGGFATDPLKVYLPHVNWVQPQGRKVLIAEVDVIGARRGQPVLPRGATSYTLPDGRPTAGQNGVAMPRSLTPLATTVAHVRVDQWVLARFALRHPTWIDVNQLKALAPQLFHRAPIKLLVFFQTPGR
ncbi:MAG: glycosyltransferase family 39 protein [Solirubrobacteraceae bacterium]